MSPPLLFSGRGCVVLILFLLKMFAAAAESLQLCPTLCDPIDGSPPGSPVPGILQARTVEWVAISFSNAWQWEVQMKSLTHLWLLATPWPWAAAHQAPPPMGFSRQECWSGLPLPAPQCLLLIYKSWSHLWPLDIFGRMSIETLCPFFSWVIYLVYHCVAIVLCLLWL